METIVMHEIWSKLVLFAASVIVNGAIIAGAGYLIDVETKPPAVQTAACARSEASPPPPRSNSRRAPLF